MKKRELEAIIEAQAAEIADLRRRVEALEARPPITIAAPEPQPYREPWTFHPPYPRWGDNIWCDTRMDTWAPGIQG